HLLAQLVELHLRSALETVALVEHRLHRPEQIAHLERLRDVVVGAELHAVPHLLALLARRQEEEGQRLRLGIAADGLERLVAVHVGHDEIADHQIGAVFLDALETDPPVGRGLDDVTLDLEYARDLVAKRTVVVDQENATHDPPAQSAPGFLVACQLAMMKLASFPPPWRADSCNRRHRRVCRRKRYAREPYDAMGHVGARATNRFPSVGFSA